MKKVLAIITLATAISVPALPAIAQQQGSSEAADYASSWSAVGGFGGAYSGPYARYGHVRHPHRSN